MKLVDRTGQRFGRLSVVEQAGRNELKKFFGSVDVIAVQKL